MKINCNSESFVIEIKLLLKTTFENNYNYCKVNIRSGIVTEGFVPSPTLLCLKVYIIIIIIIKTSSTSPSGKNKVVYKLLSQRHKHLRHGKREKIQLC